MPNLFDMLRNGKRTLSAELMDVILQALDAINVMFAQVQNREPTSPASADLLHDLHELCKPEGQEQLRTASVAAPQQPEPEPEPVIVAESAPVAVNGGGSIDEISADEFERLLDELHGAGKAPTVSAAPVLSGSGDITDDEFEALLDQLHGQGQHGGAPDLSRCNRYKKRWMSSSTMTSSNACWMNCMAVARRRSTAWRRLLRLPSPKAPAAPVTRPRRRSRPAPPPPNPLLHRPSRPRLPLLPSRRPPPKAVRCKTTLLCGWIPRPWTSS